MDLAKTTNEKKLNLCRWYFKVGFAFLPFVWTINAIWFYSEGFLKEPFEEQKHIKKYILLSGIGSLIWFSILVTWITVFQENREEWGQIGDSITFIIPYGDT